MGLCAQWEADISGTDTRQHRMLDKSLQGETHVCIEMSLISNWIFHGVSLGAPSYPMGT